MFRGRSTERLLVAGKGFAFAVEMCDFFSPTASVAVSDTICQVFFLHWYWKMLTKQPAKLKKIHKHFCVGHGYF